MIFNTNRFFLNRGGQNEELESLWAFNESRSLMGPKPHSKAHQYPKTHTSSLSSKNPSKILLLPHTFLYMFKHHSYSHFTQPYYSSHPTTKAHPNYLFQSFLAFIMAIKYAVENEWTRLWVESDSTLVVHLVKTRSD